MTCIARQVHEWLGALSEGEEVTTAMMREIVDLGDCGTAAVSAALAAFSLCDPPLLDLVGRRYNGRSAYYVYARTATPIRPPLRPGFSSKGGTVGATHGLHVYRGADFPMEN